MVASCFITRAVGTGDEEMLNIIDAEVMTGERLKLEWKGGLFF